MIYDMDIYRIAKDSSIQVKVAQVQPSQPVYLELIDTRSKKGQQQANELLQQQNQFKIGDIIKSPMYTSTDKTFRVLGINPDGTLSVLALESRRPMNTMLYMTDRRGKTVNQWTKIKDAEASHVSWYRYAVADGEFRDLKDRVNSIKDDIRDVKKDGKDFDSRLKKIEKQIDSLNIGTRRFDQAATTFNSLQRKLERMETVVQQWNNYKKEMDDTIKKQVEKHTKARISDITPQAF
jgi:hypothetical protein